jgi:hypothetical protein
MEGVWQRQNQSPDISQKAPAADALRSVDDQPSRGAECFPPLNWMVMRPATMSYANPFLGPPKA